MGNNPPIKNQRTKDLRENNLDISHPIFGPSLNLEAAVGSQKSAQALGAPRSLSKIRPIYCGCAGFGQIFRSFSLNSHHYSPQTIETSDSNQPPLVTIANLGQAPRKIQKCLITTEVTTTFCISPCTPISYTAFLRPTAVSRLNGPQSTNPQHSCAMPRVFLNRSVQIRPQSWRDIVQVSLSQVL